MRKKVSRKTGIGRISEFFGAILIILLFFMLFYNLSQRSFDETKLDADKEFKNVIELGSEKYSGRLAGTEGNVSALKYVENYFREIGVNPAGDDGTYYQNFKSMVPVHNSKPYFRIEDSKGNIVKEFVIGKDYNEFIDGYGGNGKVKSKIVFVKDWIRNHKPEELRGKVLVMDTIPGDNDVVYCIDIGVSAILCPALDNIKKVPFDVLNKRGKTILIHYLSNDNYNKLKSYADKNYYADIKLDEPIKMLNTPNLLGKIEGKNNREYLIISAHIDGLGSEPSGIWYPGAIEGSSGAALVMELARVASLQKNKPEKTIVFALWNNEEYGRKGKEYYSEHPIYPLERSEIIYLNNLGTKSYSIYNIEGKGQTSQILKDKISQFILSKYKNMKGSTVASQIPQTENIDMFAKKNATAISVEESIAGIMNNFGEDGAGTLNTPRDDIRNIGVDMLKNQSDIFLQFIKRDAYGDIAGGLLNTYEKLFLLILGLTLLIIYIINLINRTNPNFKLFGTGIEDIYYSVAYSILERVSYYLLQFTLIVFTVILISHVPKDFNLIPIGGVMHTNFLWNEVLQNSIKYIENFVSKGFGQTTQGYQVIDYVSYSFARSFGLLFSVTVAAVIIGIIKGITDSFRDEKQSERRAIGTLLIFSIPDVLIVVLIQLLFIFLAHHNISIIPTGNREVRGFIMTFPCLIVLPTIYISRIASTAVHEEAKKDYIKAAKAKGLSDFDIAGRHLFISIFIKVMDAMPTILSLMISNLIVAEYMCYYPGIVTNMMKAYQFGEMTTFTGLALSLSLLYVMFMIIIKGISGIVNPLKREGIK